MMGTLNQMQNGTHKVITVSLVSANMAFTITCILYMIFMFFFLQLVHFTDL